MYTTPTLLFQLRTRSSTPSQRPQRCHSSSRQPRCLGIIAPSLSYLRPSLGRILILSATAVIEISNTRTIKALLLQTLVDFIMNMTSPSRSRRARRNLRRELVEDLTKMCCAFAARTRSVWYRSFGSAGAAGMYQGYKRVNRCT